jgi:hypothetical protein
MIGLKRIVNKQDKLYDPASAAIFSAILGAGGSMAASSKAASAQREAQRKADYAAEEAKREQQRIFEATKPEDTGASVVFGTLDDEEDDELGTYNEFITQVPKQDALGTTGLGFNTLGGV